MRIAFLNSWTLDVAKGSGTAAAITGLAGGLEANGHTVEIIGPDERASSLLLQRLLYNLELKDRISPDDFDLIVGFDIDGFDLSMAVPFIVYLHGISADEMRFERGAPRQYLRALSHLERANAHRADRVIVTSEYSRGVACEAYGLPAEKVGVVGNGIHPAHWERVAAPSSRWRVNTPGRTPGASWGPCRGCSPPRPMRSCASWAAVRN
ncbi:MAG: glycosyltransferase [Nitrospinae bacterium]|nr:glycosyltransferase [Nitrospinota bacterium]